MKNNDIEVLDKKNQIYKLFFEIPPDRKYLIEKFFDFESNKNLDKKIDIFKQIKSGKNESEIENLDEILEKKPKGEGLVFW